MTTRRARFVPASKIPMEAWRAEQFDVIDAVRDILPEEWRVLPPGGSTAKAIANRAHKLHKERKDAKTPAPSFDCESCHRTIGKWSGHNVTTDQRIICSGCVEKPLHAEWFPDCGVDWHDLYDHLRYVVSDRLAVAAALGLWDPANMSDADADHLTPKET